MCREGDFVIHDRDLQRRSAAVTLSDMEIFVFPELLFSLVLANILSPRLWAWREDPWFRGYGKKSVYQRLKRLRQFLMDRYVFNLDLETWGLTTQERELARFSSCIDTDALARSNALFGYEGDKYYFDLDIRRHFGLDRYDRGVIPYWKTETVEAMDAFVHRPEFGSGAGECVSLSTLYAAAAFVVAGLPLEEIFLTATPLHSQTFLDLRDGILTNNRRLVTKPMWFNGTELSRKARRALEHERVTLVGHVSGSIHLLYDEADIDPEAYARFGERLRGFLKAPLDGARFVDFLRQASPRQSLFQVRHPGKEGRVAPLETVFEAEEASSYRLNDETRAQLLDSLPAAVWSEEPIPGRWSLEVLEEGFDRHTLDLSKPKAFEQLRRHLARADGLPEELAGEIRAFLVTDPDLPQAETKRFVRPDASFDIRPGMERQEILEQVVALRDTLPAADLALYAWRDWNRTDPAPFLHAALERNPVSLCATADRDREEILAAVRDLEEGSIYDGAGRLAQPDETWNFGRGDGAEKAVLLLNLLRARCPERPWRLEVDPQSATVSDGESRYVFPSAKGLHPFAWSAPAALSPPPLAGLCEACPTPCRACASG